MEEEKTPNVELLTKEVGAAFNRLIGGFLELSEGFFKEDAEEKKWTGFRKLVLDMGNNSKRLITDKLEGRSFQRYNYTLVKKKEN